MPLLTSHMHLHRHGHHDIHDYYDYHDYDYDYYKYIIPKFGSIAKNIPPGMHIDPSPVELLHPPEENATTFC